MFQNDKLKIFIVGTSEYEYAKDFPPIRNVEANIHHLREIFSDKKYVEITSENIVTKLNIETDELLDELEKFIDNNNQTDSPILFYYCGHGTIDKSDSERPWYMTMKDSKPGRLDKTAISVKDIRKRFSRSKAKQKILIFDSCFSGEILKGLLAADTSDTLDSRIQDMKSIDGVFAIASAGSIEAEFDKDDPSKPTDFTFQLLQVIKDGLDTEKDFCTINEVIEEVERRLIKANKPKPAYIAANKGSEIPFIRNIVYYKKHGEHKSFSSSTLIGLCGNDEDQDYMCVLDNDSIDICVQFLKIYPMSDMTEEIKRILEGRMEQIAWRFAFRSDNVEMLKKYLEKYGGDMAPNAKMAKRKIKELESHKNHVSKNNADTNIFTNVAQKHEENTPPDVSKLMKE